MAGRPFRRHPAKGPTYTPRDAIRRIDPRSGRQHAARTPEPGHPRARPIRSPAAPPGQARDAQSRRLGQGPDRPADDRGGRARRAPQAGRDDHRADIGQYRPRAGDRRRPQGLSLHLRHGRQAVDREAGAASGIRLRGRSLPDERCPRIAGELLLRRRAARPRHPGCVQAGPVLERGEPEGPRANDRSRDLGADERRADPFRGERRHGWDDLGGDPLPPREEARAGRRRGGSRGKRPVGRRGSAVPDRRRRRGLLSRDVRSGNRRSLGPSVGPRRVRGCSPADPRGGDPCRRFMRDGTGCRARGRPRADRCGRRRRQGRRRAPARWWSQLPLEGL